MDDKSHIPTFEDSLLHKKDKIVENITEYTHALHDGLSQGQMEKEKELKEYTGTPTDKINESVIKPMKNVATSIKETVVGVTK